MVGSLARSNFSKRVLLSSGCQTITKHRLISSTATSKAEIDSVSRVDLQQPPPILPSRPSNLNGISHKQQRKSAKQQSGTAEAQVKRGVRHFKPRESIVKKPQVASKALGAKNPLQHILNHPAASIILRDACNCSKCKDPNTNQREFNVAHIPADLKPSTVEQDVTGNWTIRWENDIPGWEDHVSVYTPHQINRLQTYMTKEHHVSTQLWDKQEIAKDRFSITYDKYMTSDIDLAETLHYFARYGLVFIKDVPEDELSVKRLAQRIAAVKSTFYGETWDVRSIPEAKNVAYTSKYLGFHGDLLYTKEPPTVQYLHCLQNTTQGGESRFVDQFKAFDILCSEDRELAAILSLTKLRYEYENDGFYYSDIKPIVQRKRETHRFPQRNVRGAKNVDSVGYIYRMFWSPPFLGSVVCGNARRHAALEQKIAAMKKYAEILERDELVYEEKMEPGTCVMFDNLRVLHARNEFDMNSGKRWLRGAYLDGQDLWSMEMKLKDHLATFERTFSQQLEEAAAAATESQSI